MSGPKWWCSWHGHSKSHHPLACSCTLRWQPCGRPVSLRGCGCPAQHHLPRDLRPAAAGLAEQARQEHHNGPPLLHGVHERAVLDGPAGPRRVRDSHGGRGDRAATDCSGDGCQCFSDDGSSATTVTALEKAVSQAANHHLQRCDLSMTSGMTSSAMTRTSAMTPSASSALSAREDRPHDAFCELAAGARLTALNLQQTARTPH